MRSIFILFVMLQWTRSGCGVETIPEAMVDDESEKYAEMMNIDESSDSSVEELTTLNYETKTEPNPPILTPTASTLLEATVPTASPVLMKLVAYEATELPIEIPTEAPTEVEEQPLRKTNIKPIKPRLIDISARKDDETVGVFVEDTTPITDSVAESNDTNNGDFDEPTTVQPPTSKKPKKIEIYKTRPNELLRHYVEDSHLRSPVAALIDKKSNPLSKAKKLWKAALKPNSLLDIMVVSYDSEGIKSTYNLTNTRAMMTTLDRVREENATNQESKTYYSIIRTGQLIPYDSAIFLSTDNLPNDTEHQQPASMILLKKRIRLYLVIFDEKNHVVNESVSTAVRQTGFLGQLALRTGGDIIYVPNHAFKRDGEMGLITLVVGNRLKPIDSELKEVNENALKNENLETVVESEETTSIH